jgi:large subunit ribosomal protein L24
VKIKRGDNVEIVSGRDKGHRGEVIKVLPSKARIMVQGANLRKKHQKQVQAGGRTMNPGIIQFEASMHVSNVMLVCPKCDEPVRVGILQENEERQRVCKNCEALIDS